MKNYIRLMIAFNNYVSLAFLRVPKRAKIHYFLKYLSLQNIFISVGDVIRNLMKVEWKETEMILVSVSTLAWERSCSWA